MHGYFYIVGTMFALIAVLFLTILKVLEIMAILCYQHIAISESAILTTACYDSISCMKNK